MNRPGIDGGSDATQSRGDDNSDGTTAEAVAIPASGHASTVRFTFGVILAMLLAVWALIAAILNYLD
jgi:hypothetical protein